MQRLLAPLLKVGERALESVATRLEAAQRDVIHSSWMNVLTF
jgi:hypothetical protein